MARASDFPSSATKVSEDLILNLVVGRFRGVRRVPALPLLVVAVFAGWLGLIAPASSVIEGITTIGFIAFFAFMLSLGIAILLRQRRPAAA